MGRAKLTQEMVDQAVRLKADGLSNGDIICALGVHESTFYRWIGEPKNKLQRELSERLKKEESEFKRTLLTTIRAAAMARNQYWTAAAWLLERKFPDEYGKADRRRDEKAGDEVPKIFLGPLQMIGRHWVVPLQTKPRLDRKRSRRASPSTRCSVFTPMPMRM